ncbi:DUF2612 domain-containing protein [Acetobacteraceae bacterium]|nr:DUF2612 domain-containing protein [Acetobacteraceae bacterium]
MKNLQETFYAQYANSPILTGLLERFNKAIDPEPLIETFLTQILDPTTATGWGLDVWGRIVGVGRVVHVPVTNAFFGFEEASEDAAMGTITGFDQARFYLDDSAPLTSNYPLTDEAFRRLIFCKAAANITDGSIQSLNGALMLLFGGNGKNIWVEDTPDTGLFFGFLEGGKAFAPFGQGLFFNDALNQIATMQMTLCWDFQPSPTEITLMTLAGGFIKPSGVALEFKYVPALPSA